ncbi:MAG: phage tail sheath family protein [Desulfobacteraceae bacterium]|nr:phage tail sheath family protein [Desulfobacteraceae bacterium]
MTVHGITVNELATSILAPRQIEAAIPVAIGTAPVHRTTQRPANTPVLAYSYDSAVKQLGFDSDWSKYTLCEVINSVFVLYCMSPLVCINVFDPDTHYKEVEALEVTLENGEATLDEPVSITQINDQEDGLGTDYAEGDDYTIDYATGKLSRTETGAIISDSATLFISYKQADPSKVTVDDIKAGILKVKSVFSKFRIVPGVLLAPGWTHDSGVAAVLSTAAERIAGGFSAVALLDLFDTDEIEIKSFADCVTCKNSSNFTSEFSLCLWPKLSLGGVEYWQSSQLAGLIMQTVADSSGVPYRSPSNKNYQMDSAVHKGESVWLDPDEAGFLNNNGIVTALNHIGGWKCWGNRTAIFPFSTDVKDMFIPVRLMFNWIRSVIILTTYQKLDAPITRRNIETILDTLNIWLNGLTAQGFILGGRVECSASENPITDILNGKINFHAYVTPPAPAEHIAFLVEYDANYINTLF